MASPKEYGKLVEELTPEELRRERHRCATLLQIYGPKRPAGKGAQKRLHAIDRRIARETSEAEAT